nr:hypothetical protein [Rhodococcus opacus]
MDMWATPDESREYIAGQYRTAWAHADDTIRTLPLDATVGLRPDKTNVPAEDRTWWQRATGPASNVLHAKPSSTDEGSPGRRRNRCRGDDRRGGRR